jgi:hypothetical protein
MCACGSDSEYFIVKCGYSIEHCQGPLTVNGAYKSKNISEIFFLDRLESEGLHAWSCLRLNTHTEKQLFAMELLYIRPLVITST